MIEARSRVILGIDPGTASMGYGVVSQIGNRLSALDFGVIQTPAQERSERRLAALFANLGEVLARHKPDATAVESLFFNVNVRTALAVGQARGVALLACAQVGCEVFEYTPQQIKRAVVGYGKATKEQVMEMVKVLLHMAECPYPDHAADALGVAICHANTANLRDSVDRSIARSARKPVGT